MTADGTATGISPAPVNGAEALADLLAGYRVTHLFHVPAILRRTMAELERRQPQIERIVTHGEKSAAYMADGFARVSGRPGICAAQAVGALNLAAGLREPFLAGSPVIALTGGRLPLTKFRQVYQEADDLPAFDKVTKFNASIDHPARVPDMLRQAFRMATSGAPGPVHLQFQGNEGQVDLEEAEMPSESAEDRFRQVPPFRPSGDADELALLLGELRAARRPVIVVGGGARASDAGAELRTFAERESIPVVTSANGRDVIPGTHPLCFGVVGTYSRESANLIVGQADLVFFLGTQAGGMTTHFWAVPSLGTRAVQVDIEPTHLGRNYPTAAAVYADVRVALRQLLAMGSETPPPARDGWLRECEQRRAEWAEKYREVLVSDDVPIRPERLAADLGNGLPSDAVLIVDTGHAGMWMSQFLDLTSADQDYLRSAGHLGWAFSAGIGAKCAVPDRPTVVFTGDAGFYYHLGELETAVRRGVNLVTVVNNNGGGNQSKRGFDRAYGGESSPQAHELWTYHEVDFARVAGELGALGLRVDKPGDFEGALDQALSSGRPTVIDVHTDIEVVAPLPVS